jgi:copper chaperone CopZ
MSNSISKILMVIMVLLSSTISFAQIKNVTTATVKINGNCEMCKANIEKAGNDKKLSTVNWNENTKLASITYDSKQTNQQEILKRIALAGYDSEEFRAPDDVYAKLAECCQYERAHKTVAKTALKTEAQNHTSHTTTEKQEKNHLKAVFESYFAVKDALVKSDGTTTSISAKDLLNALNSVKMETLTTNEHTIWMKVAKDLSFDAEHISDTKVPGHQRDHFMSLSKNMYQLIKVSEHETPVYYQHCPMYNEGKGANWLSKENAVKNPYYGSKMLTCGSVVETIGNK